MGQIFEQLLRLRIYAKYMLFLQKCRLIRVRQFVPILSLIVSLPPSSYLFTSCVVAGG